ncbi:unnamed protein product [Lampetra planeri]
MAVRMKASFVARLLVEGRKTRGLHGSRLMYALKSRKASFTLGNPLAVIVSGAAFYCLAKVARPPPGIARNQQEQRQVCTRAPNTVSNEVRACARAALAGWLAGVDARVGGHRAAVKS